VEPLPAALRVELVVRRVGDITEARRLADEPFGHAAKLLRLS